ncbi:MAG: hybrid sensor histidine kinase/response regulator [Coriobacteriia bacterium]
MVEFDRSAFIGKFQEEAQEYLQRLNEGVITLEGDPGNRELIDQMLRDAHTLKGSSRMVGLLEIADVAHRLEDIMVKVRDGLMAYTPQMSDPFFEALDAIVFLSDNAGKDVAGQLDIPGLLARLGAIADSGEVAVAPEPVETPAPAVIAGEDDGEDDDEGDVAEASEAHDASEGPQRAKRDETLKAKVQHTVRVRTSQVDTLLNLVSEVVITQIKAEQRSFDLRAVQSETADIWSSWVRMRAAVSALEDGSESLGEEIASLDGLLADWRGRLGSFAKDYVDDVSRTSTVVADLQEHAMRLRMLPVATVFNTFPRAVHDLAHDFHKEVELEMHGEDTELDKKVLEEINDPLIHIMRNAVDHGIESPATRVAQGKPSRGTISMSARQEGDHIVIEVSDDGAGIDPELVRTAAVRKGFVGEAEARSMSEREATYLIFEAGFSTSPIITEISGRGVGMDVVREFVVDKLKGSLDLDTKLGEGTTFRLTIPLTLAIIRALLLRCGGQTFALPTASIEETLRIEPSQIIKVEGREVVRRQRRTIPLVHLADILGLPVTERDGSKIRIVVVGFSGHRMGYIVDELVGEQQIVIKTLGSHLKGVDNIAGVTVLGAGEIVPILNVPDLMTNARTRSGLRRATVSAENENAGPKRVLICEDSFTTRELERSIFEAAGYEVEVATDGAMGLSMLREGLQIDAVVTDVQMPNMNGFEFTRAVKNDAQLHTTPIVIVTSLERDEEKAEGIDAGADAYITKSVFNQDTLLDTVERLIR